MFRALCDPLSLSVSGTYDLLLPSRLSLPCLCYTYYVRPVLLACSRESSYGFDEVHVGGTHLAGNCAEPLGAEGGL